MLLQCDQDQAMRTTGRVDQHGDQELLDLADVGSATALLLNFPNPATLWKLRS